VTSAAQKKSAYQIIQQHRAQQRINSGSSAVASAQQREIESIGVMAYRHGGSVAKRRVIDGVVAINVAAVLPVTAVCSAYAAAL